MMAAKLLKKAEELAGRKLEVERTKDGSFIVLYMCFGKSPPPKGKSPEEALQGFIDYMERSRPVDPGTAADYEDLQKELDSEQSGDNA